MESSVGHAASHCILRFDHLGDRARLIALSKPYNDKKPVNAWAVMLESCADLQIWMLCVQTVKKPPEYAAQPDTSLHCEPSSILQAPYNWVAVKELKLGYHNGYI